MRLNGNLFYLLCSFFTDNQMLLLRKIDSKTRKIIDADICNKLYHELLVKFGKTGKLTTTEIHELHWKNILNFLKSKMDSGEITEEQKEYILQRFCYRKFTYQIREYSVRKDMHEEIEIIRYGLSYKYNFKTNILFFCARMSHNTGKLIIPYINQFHNITILSISNMILINQEMLFQEIKSNIYVKELTITGMLHEIPLFEALCENKAIVKLCLMDSGLNLESANKIKEMLIVNNVIEDLNLDFNSIGCSAVEKICEGLEKNKTLRYLNLARNRIQVEGAKALANLLKDNKSLRSLVLSRNQFNDEGAESILLSLKTNQSLTELYLDFNDLTDENSINLIELLNVNYHLKIINVYANNFSQKHCSKLFEALKKNKTLQEFNIGDNGLDLASLKQIGKLISKNLSIK
jgi:Ran GTPase-activating protein (RanGAP) involved in mRNA processing and transport